MKVYVDQLSQPSRAVLIMLKKLKVPFEEIETSITKGANKTPEFAKMFPEKKVPTILDGDFALSQSHTIMRYVIQSRNIQTDLYPLNDIKQCARIDSYLDYHHTNTRKCAIFMFMKAFAPRLKVTSEVSLETLEKETEAVLKYIDRGILKQIILFIYHKQSSSVVLLTGYDLSKHPNLSRWLRLMMEDPEVKISHVPLFKVIKKFNPDPKL